MEKPPFNIYEYIQTDSIDGILNYTDEYQHRRICRWYSQTFHTPLHIVEDNNQIPWFKIVQHWFEYNWEKEGHNFAINKAKEIIPQLSDKEEKETDEFIKALLEADKNKKQSLKKSTASKNVLNTQKDVKNPTSTPNNKQEEFFKTFEDEDPI